MTTPDTLLGVARAAFDSIYDGPGSEDAAHRAALDAVYPMIWDAVLGEAAGAARDIAEDPEADDYRSATAFDVEDAILALAQQGAQQGREDER